MIIDVTNIWETKKIVRFVLDLMHLDFYYFSLFTITI